MSKVIINKKKEVSKTKNYFIIGLVLLLIMILSIFIISDNGYNPTPLILIPFALCGLPSLYYLIEFKKKKNFIKAKNKAFKDFQNLSDNFTVMRDVYIPYEDKILECGYIIIGQNAVFLVDVKGDKGCLYESDNESYWIRYLSKRKGKTFMKTFHNPTKAVDLKVWALSNYLKKYNIRVWIQGIVYYNNKNVALNLVNYKDKVFSSEMEIINYITNFPAKKEIDEVKIEKIVKLLSLENIS